MKVTLLAHTQLNKEFKESLSIEIPSDGQAISLMAIRNCYSSNHPDEILELEGKKYFESKATDGEGGTEAERLIRHIIRSGHQSTIEHLGYTFSVEGVSRALLAQISRHRVGFSMSVKSQRYVKYSSDSKSGGFDYVTPEKVMSKGDEIELIYDNMMDSIQNMYNELIKLGIPQEDARSVLPQSATCDIVLTVNLRSLLDFYNKRKAKSGAQLEITQLAEELKEKVIEVEGWTKQFFVC